MPSYPTRTISFPSTITTTSPAMIRFRFYDSASLKPDAATATVILPAPLALSSNYNVSFDDLESGLFEVILDTLLTAGTDFAGALSAKGDALDVSAAAFGGLVNAATKIGTSLISGTDIARRIVGGGKNKRNELVVNKPQNRAFSMRFQLVPSNQKESDVIQEIINTFKIAMHPPSSATIAPTANAADAKSKALFFMNPARVKVDFLFRDSVKGEDGFSTDNINRKIFSTSFCFISNLDVNYHNAGAPSYFADGQPGNMSFSIQMTEVHPNSREMIKRIDIGDNDKQFGNFSDTVNPIDSVIDRAPGPVSDVLQPVAEFLGLTDSDVENIAQQRGGN